MDLAELTCDLSIADCIKEVAENRVRLRMHVGAFVVPLQRLKFIDRVFLVMVCSICGFGGTSNSTCPSLRFETKLKSSRPDMTSNRRYSRWSFRHQLTSQSPR